LEVEVEVGERMVLDVARAIAQRLELGQPLRRLAPALGEADLQLGERILQVGVDQRGVRIVLEVVGGRLHQRPPSVSPVAALLPMSAGTSATWRTGLARPPRWSLPAMFIRQPRSPANRVSAPAAAMSLVFSPTMALEISGYFTQKVPPKPQHTSGDFISRRLSPSTEASSRRGWSLTPSSRRPEQES